MGASVEMIDHYCRTLLDGATADIAGQLDAEQDQARESRGNNSWLVAGA